MDSIHGTWVVPRVGCYGSPTRLDLATLPDRLSASGISSGPPFAAFARPEALVHSRYITIKQAAERYALSPAAIRKRIRRSAFPGVCQARPGGPIRIDVRLADAWHVRHIDPTTQRALIGPDWRTLVREDGSHE